MDNLTFNRLYEILIAGILAISVVAIPYGIFSTVSDLTKVNRMTNPVVANMKITAARKSPTEDVFYIRVVGDKLRSKEECGGPLAIVGAYGTNAFESIIFMDDVERGRIGLPDAQSSGTSIDFGWWKIRPKPDSHILVFKVYHDCGVGIVQTPFKLILPDDFF